MKVKMVNSWPPCWVADEAKHRADLADERALHPQASRLIHEVAQLRRDVAEPRAAAEYDGVIVGQLIDRGDRRLLVELEVRFPGHFFRHQFRHPLHVDLGAGRLGPFRHGVRHLLDMSVGGIIQHQHLGHRCLLVVAIETHAPASLSSPSTSSRRVCMASLPSAVRGQLDCGRSQ